MSQAAVAVAVENSTPAAPPAPGPIDHSKRTPSFDYMAMMREVAQTGGKSYFAQTREMYELKFGPGRISPVEYYYYGLFDDALSKEQKRAFVGVNLRAEINKHVLDKEFFGVGKDKIAFYAFMAGVGLPIPRTLGLCHATRSLQGAAVLRDGAAFANFLRNPAIYPLFCKPAHLTASVGAASLPRLTLTGWDVSITEKGPVLIELEPDGGDPAVTQLASGEGLLNGAYGAFVERNRAKMKAKG